MLTCGTPLVVVEGARARVNQQTKDDGQLSRAHNVLPIPLPSPPSTFTDELTTNPRLYSSKKSYDRELPER